MKTATAPPPKAAEVKARWPDPSLPSKGLLPKSLVAKREVRKFTLRAGVIGLTVVALAGLGWGGLAASSASAYAAQQDQELANTVLGESVSGLQVIDRSLKAFDAQRASVAAALQNDVTYSAVVTAVRASAPVGVEIDSIKSTFGSVCDGPDPFNAKPAIGCLTVDGAAPSVPKVSEYVTKLIALSSDPAKPAWLVDPYATTASSGSDTTGATGVASGQVVRFTLTVNFTPEALSLKYAKFLPGTGDTTTAPVVTEAGG